MVIPKNKTLVLGASLKSNRYSNRAIEELVAHGELVVAIGSRIGTVAGISIETKPVSFKEIDTVTLYLNPQLQEQYYQYILALNPRRVIFNPGAENLEFEKTLRAHGILVDCACTLVLLRTNQY